MPESQDITRMLNAMRSGDDTAGGHVVSAVYSELKRLAAYYMRKERSGHTLQPTALVNEAYARLLGSEKMEWQDRAHFFAVAARQMRRVLVDHARSHQADKRGGGGIKVTLSHADAAAAARDEDLVAVDIALGRLEEMDARAAHVVELKYFSGLTDKEAAEVLGVPLATVRRDWEFARAWLYRHLAGGRT